jgi:hypothetical protein
MQGRWAVAVTCMLGSLLATSSSRSSKLVLITSTVFDVICMCNASVGPSKDLWLAVEHERVEGGVNKALLLANAHCSCAQSCSGTMLAQLSTQRVTMKPSYAIQDTN